MLLVPKRAELKFLCRSPGRGVLMVPGIDQFKTVSKLCGKTVCVVTADRQATAAFRAIGRERADDRVPAKTQGASKPINVSHLVRRIGEKV
jgi:hypothetical protein